MTYISLIIDLVVAGLLVATIVYCSVLNRKLATLRSSKQEMESLAGRLVESTQHAERALADLKSAANDTGEQLERRVAEARNLVDDLRFLVDKGSGLADRLASDIDKGRPSGSGKAGSGKPGARKAAASKTGAGRAGADGDTGQQRERRGARQKAAGESKTAAANAEPRWDDEENAPDADPQLLKALRQVR